jgi:hypothetical protein
MSRQYHIQDFVQHILGCTCPDKVFEQIEDRRVAPSFSPHTRIITIGGRLLIYIWNVKGADRLKENLFAMLEAGKKERDEKGLNRFRAVLAFDTAAQHCETSAKSYFSQYAGKDDRMHIHVVSTENLKDV